MRERLATQLHPGLPHSSIVYKTCVILKQCAIRLTLPKIRSKVRPLLHTTTEETPVGKRGRLQAATQPGDFGALCGCERVMFGV